MGYEGHAVGVEDRATRVRRTEAAMERLASAHADVGGEVCSAGGTGTYDCNPTATEIQAGSYALMDTAYARLDLPFTTALTVLATVISVHDGWAVADCGLKALGMDHGNPSLVDGGAVWFCSDEHVTFVPPEGHAPPRVGDRIELVPAHVDPTVAYHEVLHVVDTGHTEVVERWPVDLRGW
jgi:D-serine deaminase-like pyridoxal phosphate-dependent protein